MLVALTEENLRRVMEQMRNRRGMSFTPDVLIVNPWIKARIDYYGASRMIRSWPGAERWRGPDGREWLMRRWFTARPARGSGNRAKRRQGLVPVPVWGGEYEWRQPG